MPCWLTKGSNKPTHPKSSQRHSSPKSPHFPEKQTENTDAESERIFPRKQPAKQKGRRRRKRSRSKLFSLDFASLTSLSIRFWFWFRFRFKCFSYSSPWRSRPCRWRCTYLRSGAWTSSSRPSKISSGRPPCTRSEPTLGFVSASPESSIP